MEYFLLWLFFVVFSVVVASSKNRSAVGWGLIGFFLGPFGLIVAALPAVSPETAVASRLGSAKLAGTRNCPHCDRIIAADATLCTYCYGTVERVIPPSATDKQCPYCAETIKAAAVVCRFCNKDLNVSARKVVAETVVNE